MARLLRRRKITGWRRHFQIKLQLPAAQISHPASRPFTVRPDFVFSKSHLAIFVDGCFWHGCPVHGTKPKGNRAFWKKKFAANIARDRRVNRTLRAGKWRVIRIWEHTLRRAIMKPEQEARLLKRISEKL